MTNWTIWWRLVNLGRISAFISTRLLRTASYSTASCSHPTFRTAAAMWSQSFWARAVVPTTSIRAGKSPDITHQRPVVLALMRKTSKRCVVCVLFCAVYSVKVLNFVEWLQCFCGCTSLAFVHWNSLFFNIHINWTNYSLPSTVGRPAPRARV